MKRIGIIGGLGPEATIDYYTRIIDAFKIKNTSFNYPDIIVYSVNLSVLIKMMEVENYEGLTDYLSEKLDALERSGAEFAVFSANTPHMIFDQLQAKTKLHLVSIVEATCNECIKREIKRAGLIGTGFTMDASFYQDVFNKHGIEVVVPNSDDRKVVNHKLFSEIELGIFKDDTRQILVEVIERMVVEQKIDSMILGCTEFPLILTKDYYAGIPMLNTTQIHVEAIIDYCLK